MRTHATSRMWETSLQNCQILENLLGNIKMFLLLKSNFPHAKFDFLQWLSAFFNGFPLSSTAFGFSTMAFLFPRNPRKSIYGGKYTKNHHSSFVFPATCSPSFVIATRSPSFVIATRYPSFVFATMPTSHPTPSTWPCDCNRAAQGHYEHNGESKTTPQLPCHLPQCHYMFLCL